MTESDAVVVHVELMPEDCIAFHRTLARIFRPHSLEWARAGAWVFYVLSIIVVPVWLGADRRSAGIVLLCSLIGVFPLIVLMRYVPDVDWSGSSALRPTDITLSSVGVSFKNAVVDVTCDWRAFHRLDETPTHFFLYVDKLMAHIVPKRCFSSADETDRFRTIAHTNIQLAQSSA
jgi:hypothetical protein